MTKVVKLALISNVNDKDGNKVEYNELNRCLWDLQKETRDLKNAVVRECWEWYGFTNDYYKLNEEYPNERDYLKKAKSDGTIKDYALDGFIYAKYSKKYNLHSGNYSQTLRDACGSFKNNLKEILRGDKSILSYRADQPLDIKKTCIGLEYDKDTNTYYVTLVLLNKNGVKHYKWNGAIPEDIMMKILIYGHMNDSFSTEFLLLGLAYNIKKLFAKISENRLGISLFELKTA